MRRRISQYVTDFFPPTYVGPKRYTEQALRYATPHRKARAMVAHMESLMPPGRFAILEVFGGIGCNSLAFMESARARLVGVIEGHPQTAAMATSNTSTWAALLGKPAPTVYAIRPTVTDLVTLVPRTENVAVFMDPPWGDQQPYTDPIQYSLGTPAETVEQCVHALLAQPSVQTVMVKVPKTEFPLAHPPAGVTLTRHKRLKKMDLLCFTKGP